MYIYLTSGTPDFMENVQKKYSKEKMIVLHGTGNSVLLHETAGKSVFATPRRFEVLDSAKELDDHGFFVLENIPVSTEGSKLFEHHFLNRTHTIEKEPGFLAYRLLKPIHDDTYIILSEWTGPQSFEVWKASSAYKDAFNKDTLGDGIDRNTIFTSAPYAKTYATKRPEEDVD